MNFNVDCSEKKSPPFRRIVPLLVLVKEWGGLGNDAFDQIDVVLLLLQGIRSADEGKAIPVCDIKKRLEEISSSFAAKYHESLQNITSDLTLFMDLFDNLSKLSKSSDESSPSVLDSDYKHSVLGVFVHHCVLEYKRLTFSQLVRVHASLQADLKQTTDDALHAHEEHKEASLQLDEHNFTKALEKLRLCQGSSGKQATPPWRAVGGDYELGKEALQLTQLHGQFGHKEEAVFALQEAIRLAQQHTDSLLLEYALAWLHQLQPCSGEDTLIILNKYVKNAVDLKMPKLGVWGRLQQAKTKLELAQEPRNVMDVVMSSEAEFGSLHEFDREKSRSSEQSSILSFMAATWDFYGGKLQGLLHSQLLCHLMSCDHPSSGSRDDSEPLALSLSMMARYMAEMGNYNDGEEILRSAKKKLSTKQSFKVLSVCLEELLFDQSLLQEDFNKAQHHLNSITTLDHHSAQYRSALLCKAKGNLHKAMELTQDFLKRLDISTSDHMCKLQYKARFLILLAEIYSDLGLPAMALPHVIDSLAVCESNHLPTHHAKLCLAQLQLQMGSPVECLETVKNCMLQTQCQGSLLDRGMTCFLITQAKLLTSKDGDHHLDKNDTMALCPMLTRVIHCFQSISAKDLIRKSMLLQVHLFNFVGFDDERDTVLSQLKNL